MDHYPIDVKRDLDTALVTQVPTSKLILNVRVFVPQTSGATCPRAPRGWSLYTRTKIALWTSTIYMIPKRQPLQQFEMTTVLDPPLIGKFDQPPVATVVQITCIISRFVRHAFTIRDIFNSRFAAKIFTFRGCFTVCINFCYGSGMFHDSEQIHVSRPNTPGTAYTTLPHFAMNSWKQPRGCVLGTLRVTLLCQLLIHSTIRCQLPN